MRFLVNQDLFSEESNDPQLWTMVLAILAHEHTLLLCPSWRSNAEQPVHRFLVRTNSRALNFLTRRALERGLDELRSGLRDQQIFRVGSSTEKREYPLAEAIRLAWTPLWLVLENGRNDLAFLRRALPALHRAWLDRQLTRGQIEVPPSGGTGELDMLLQRCFTTPENSVFPSQEAIQQAERRRTARLWIMFDRDVDSQDIQQPSKTSLRLQELAKKAQIPCIPLGRRTMENYLPRSVLKEWAGKGNTYHERNLREKKVEVFFRMSLQQRCIYNFKEGILKDMTEADHRGYQSKRKSLAKKNLTLLEFEKQCADGVSSENIPPLFRSIPLNELPFLLRGFGAKIGEGWTSTILEEDIDKVFAESEEDLRWRELLVRSLRKAR